MDNTWGHRGSVAATTLVRRETSGGRKRTNRISTDLLQRGNRTRTSGRGSDREASHSSLGRSDSIEAAGIHDSADGRNSSPGCERADRRCTVRRAA